MSPVNLMLAVEPTRRTRRGMRRRARARRWSTRAAVACIVVAWLIAGALQWTSLTLELRAASRQVRAAREQDRETQHILESLDALERASAPIRAFRAGPPAAEALELIARLIPESATLDTLAFKRAMRETPARKGKPRIPDDPYLAVSMTGASADDDTIARLISALTESPFLRAIETRNAPSKGRAEHQLSLAFEVARPRMHIAERSAAP